jgi:WD40 repeat protein
VFEAHCLRCHSAAVQKGSLILDAHEDVVRGGRKGAVLVAGDSAGSRLVAMIEGRLEPVMPPKGRLRPEDVAIVRAWIDAGAPDSPAAAFTLDARLPSIRPAAAVRAPVNSLAFHPNGREIVVPGYREARRIAVPARGRRAPAPGPARAARVLEGAIDLVRSVAVSPDGWWIAGGGGVPGAVGEVIVWDAERDVAAQHLRGHRDYVSGAAFNRRSTRLATASYDRTVRIWDLDTGRALQVLREHTEAVYGVAFSADGRWVASASGDRSVKLWDVRSGKRLVTLTDATDALNTVDFHPQGARLTAAGADKTIRTWSITAQGGRQLASVLAHTAAILRVAYSPDGGRLASSASDGSVKIWDAVSWRELHLLEPQRDWAQALAWSPDGRSLAVGRLDGTVTLYDAKSGRPAATLVGRPRSATPPRATRQGAPETRGDRK